MSFIDFEGNPVEKGVAVTDERTIAATSVTLANGGETEVDMGGLVSVDSVVDVDVDGEQVKESPGAGNVSCAEVTNTAGNTLTVQFYLDDLSDAGNVDLDTLGVTEFTVTAEGY